MNSLTLSAPQLAEHRAGPREQDEGLSVPAIVSGSAGTQGIWPRDPGGAHPAQAPPGLRCATRACRNMVRQESPDDTWQSFQAHHRASTLPGSLEEGQ